MTVAVITSCYGGYDLPASPVVQSVPCEWVYVTDADGAPGGWRHVREPRPQLHPRLAAKVAKCCPHFYSNADVFIWLDASFEIASEAFVEWALAELGGADIALSPHPERTTFGEETRASIAISKYDGLPIREQTASYPAVPGLWETGCIVQTRVHARTAGPRWLTEQVRWTYQDQISLPAVLADAGAKVAELGHPLRAHPYLRLRPHVDGT